MPTIADRLIELQKEKNLQKKDIAEAAGLSLMGYYRYEKGQREPTASTIVKLCDFLGVSADYLLGRTDTP
jgi:transcriptional regulator with XRE-family HTH domain